MKRIFFIAIMLLSLGSMAQTGIGISSFGFFSANDTVAGGSMDTYDVWVKNYGPGVFSDVMTIVTAVQDTTAPSMLDTVDNHYTGTVTTLNPGDSALFTLTADYTTSTGGYRYGIDVIVIWPVAASANTVDSLEFTVFIENHTGISELDARELIKAYPNPALSTLSISHPDVNAIRSITIYDLSGRLILANRDESAINIEALPAGTYQVEVIMSDNKRYMIKVVKGKSQLGK
ncbi:MAG: hypothetical protein JWO09_1639 [Bacteroidetes bacterium]|nr:hypothetical protein [Bacteroidota bacterium]